MNIAWLIFTVIILLVAEMKYFGYVMLKRLTYERYFSKKAVFEDETVEMVEIIENRKLTPVPWLRVEAKISSYLKFKSDPEHEISLEKFHRSTFFLRGYKKITRKHEVKCTHRGFFRLYQTSISAGDLFELTRKSQNLPLELTLTVYPKIGETQLYPAAVKFQGDVLTRRFILPDPILINGIRGYISGDPQKEVHWPATARTGFLQTKLHDYTISPRIFVVLNSQIKENLWSIMSEEDCEVIEEGIGLSAGLLYWAFQNTVEAGFASNCTLHGAEGETVYIPPDAAGIRFEDMLDVLARLIIKREINFHSLLDNLISNGIYGMDIAIVSAYWSDTIEQRAELLRGLGNTVSYLPIKSPASTEGGL